MKYAILLFFAATACTAVPSYVDDFDDYSPADYLNINTDSLLEELLLQNDDQIENFPELFQFLNNVTTFSKVDVDGDLKESNLPEELKSAPGIIKHHGYPVEIHSVTTSDGYILELHRIPSSPKAEPRRRKQPVLLQHGLLDSSAAWLLLGPEKSLAFLLADRGYDVWLGNFRGNRYSRQHRRRNADGTRRQRNAFWDFTWHEMGSIDLPAMIDYILSVNDDYPKIHYIGHSQGTTAYFIMCSERPGYNDKILLMQAFGPLAFMGNASSKLGRELATFMARSSAVAPLLGQCEFAPSKPVFSSAASKLCKSTSKTPDMCDNVLFMAAGFNTELLNQDLVPLIRHHNPAGASSGQFVHYGQAITSGRFARFDYGAMTNLRRYYSRRPPSYNLDNIDSPMILHYSANDLLSAKKDVEELHKNLQHAHLHEVSHAKFSHIDFVWAAEAKEIVYDNVIDYMARADDGEFFLNLW